MNSIVPMESWGSYIVDNTQEQLEAKTWESIRNPMGMEPLSKLAHKGSKVTIVFPDRVKGGEQPPCSMNSGTPIRSSTIASHHVPEVLHRKDFTPVSGTSLMRTKFDEIGQHMEACMGKKFFCCDAVRIRSPDRLRSTAVMRP